ncbi:MAG: hypothetical protein PQJ61_16605 [Spirochaetales bacterium]|uniref:Uncharacterized protein n=1 Tax=Candidatus Thalassospirochaeta sargassi TaxID=3119039 RepID=A0AAJ1IJX4_9SPIO|nr:hypothetical protein [Spirochaetales bacterium]
MKKIAIIVLLVCSTQILEASVQRLVKVSYQTRTGYSDEYAMEVTFLTGQELNKATNSFNYGMFDSYALIRFNANEVAILKFDSTIIGVGSEFDAADFKNAFQIIRERTATQINSQPKRKWKIRY